MKLQNMISKIKIIILFCGLWTVVCGLCGCEVFARKFTRKPKPQEQKPEELVLVPQEYKTGQLSKEDLYRQYFLFWRTWQDELIDSLSGSNTNRKKLLDCIREATENLMSMKDLLNPEKQKILDNYIKEINYLREAIYKDLYNNFLASSLTKAQRIKRNIHRDFSFSKIKDDLK
jgi:hypothetical protein